MDYLQLTCNITSGNVELVCDILTQELADIGFESFEEISNGLLAFISEKDYNQDIIHLLPSAILDLGEVVYTHEWIKDKNWNEVWEHNFQPVVIGDKCYIRATFHEQNKAIPYEIVIEPKMAFGTGHHETTSLMIEQMLTLDLSGKRVLDMGCGTGVLAIMASMLKADYILAIDIDIWSYQNTLENCERNNITNIIVKQGDIDLITDMKFDVILANINRNILLDQISHYANTLDRNGLLLMSGIYWNDFEIISNAIQKFGFVNLTMHEKNNWIAVLFKKN